MSKRKRFRPEMTVFNSSSKILPLLLDDIVNCYQKGYSVCKFCYYRKKLANTLSRHGNGYFCSNCNSLTKTVWLIPSSQFCENFGNFKELPIPSAPKWSYEKRDKPFTMCTRRVHHGCFEMSANSEVWFAHTIEELAVWTIEREYDCSFAMYIEKYYYGGDENSGGRNTVSTSKVEKPLMVQDVDNVIDSDEVLDPNCVMFDRIEDIPKNLLEDVINNYKKAKDCCRYCYYYYSDVKVDKEWKDVPRCKECKRNWSTIKVIPASKLCQNFANLQLVPISIPVHSDNEYSYEYCNKTDHYRCFENCAENGSKYAHSIEELVIWTVERAVGQGNFSRYIKGEVTVNQIRVNSGKVTKSSNARSQTDVRKPLTYIAGGANVYTTIESIPQELLLSVGQCYERRLNICRTCFFDSLQDGRFNSNPTLSSKAQGSSMCERGHYWKGMRVVPASGLCKSYGTYIGIPPYPHHMAKSRNPFQMCKYHDHNDCYQKTREIDPWFPHSLEEIVIWTVERETGQDFKNYIIRVPTNVQASPIRPSNHSPVMAAQTQQGHVGSRDGTGLGRDRNSPVLDTAIETLVEGMQNFVMPQHPSPLVSNNSIRAASKVKMFTAYEPVHSGVASSSPLLFMDDESDEECSAGETSEKKQITLTEASYYFPALAKSGGGHVTNEDMTMPRQMPRPNEINPYIEQELQVPPADFPVPPPQFPIVQPLPSSAFPVTTPSVAPLSLDPVPQIDEKGGVVITSDDDEQHTYECYLCYREFQSAERLANHTTKNGHVDLMKKDFCYRELWQYFPYPPDQGPEDFTICTRSNTSCPGRLKCCSAHSLEEREEWMLRYHHRYGSVHNHGNTPTEVIEKCSGGGVSLSPNMNVSSYRPLKVGVKQLQCTSNTPKWKLTIAGQGWQSLLGLLCVSCEDNENRFEISAIKGDTIYTMRPQSSMWVAPSFDKGILLGCIQVIIRGVSVPVGSCDCRVKLHLGLQKYLCVELQAIVNY